MKILIVDDEALARRSIARRLAALVPEAEVREAANGLRALQEIAAFQPAIVFLDVEMPELGGLDVLRQLKSPRPKIVFVTAYSEFATRAFEENACDYLVKPFTDERFAAAFARCRSELGAEEKLRALERSLERAGRSLERLVIRTGNKIELVAVADVSCFVSIDHHTYVYTHDREHIADESLAELETSLGEARFFRTHRSAVVNLDKVLRIGEHEVHLTGGRTAPLSRRSKSELIARVRTK